MLGRVAYKYSGVRLGTYVQLRSTVDRIPPKFTITILLLSICTQQPKKYFYGCIDIYIKLNFKDWFKCAQEYTFFTRMHFL